MTRKALATLAIVTSISLGTSAPWTVRAIEEEPSAPPAFEQNCRASSDWFDQSRRSLDDRRWENRPHQAPDLEGLLPREVAGRSLSTWSVSGLDYLRDHFVFAADELELIEADPAALGAVLGVEGTEVDDHAMAVAGRWDVESDPPYFVFAYRIRSVPAVMLGPAVDRPDAGPWSLATLGSHTVLIGTEAMFDQTIHQRGRPYSYDVGDVRFTVTTDDEDWASEALTRLCPDPTAVSARFVGGRIERPAQHYAVSFPNEWIIAELSDESREWMDRWADPEQLSDTLLMAQHQGEYQCSLVDDTRYAEAAPAYASLADWIDEEAYWVKQDPTVVDFEAAYLDLTAGRTATLDVLYDDRTDGREYLLTDRTTWFRLSCISTDPPDDRWLSIAETFEFLQAEK